MSAGLYRLPAGDTDPQEPHDEDELYYVIRGKARFETEGRRSSVGPGDILFVAAGARHRFADIEEELELLVMFSKDC